MDYYKDFSKRAQIIIGEVKKAEKGNRDKLDEISRQAYSDYRNGIISGQEYDSIYALLMELAYPRWFLAMVTEVSMWICCKILLL